MSKIQELLLTRNQEQIDEARAWLRAMPREEALNEIEALTRNDNPSLRAYCALFTSEMFPDQVERLILPLLDDAKAFVRWHACESLHFNYIYAAAEKILTLLLQDTSPLVRSRAANALGDLGHPGLIAKMYQVADIDLGTDHEDTPIREIVSRSIKQISERCRDTPLC